MLNESKLPHGLQIGTEISGRYRLIRLVGKGGSSFVFSAEDLKLAKKTVALKIIDTSQIVDENIWLQFQQEADKLARLDHPNILAIFDQGIWEQYFYIVTEYVPGGSLKERIIKEGRISLDQTVYYLNQIASAVDEVHKRPAENAKNNEAGSIHRDIKPGNILLNKTNQPLLADFGLATSLNAENSMILVTLGFTAGTIPYMAPELFLGKGGKASDIYALGITTFQMITGKLPFSTQRVEGMDFPKIHEKAPDLEYPPALDEILAIACDFDLQKRYHTATEFALDVSEVVDTPTGNNFPVIRPIPPEPFDNVVPGMPPETNRTRFKIILGLVGVLVVALIIIGILGILLLNKLNPVAAPSVVVQITPTLAPTAASTTTAVVPTTGVVTAAVPTTRVVTTEAPGTVPADSGGLPGPLPDPIVFKQIQANLDSKAVTLIYTNTASTIKLFQPKQGEYTEPQLPVLYGVILNSKIQVTFYNPIGLTKWDYGFKFRTIVNKNYLQYRLRLTSDKKAFLILANAGTAIALDATTGATDTVHGGEVVATCDIPTLDITENGHNTLIFYVYGVDAYLVINDKFACKFDVSKNQEAGTIQLVSGFYPQTRDDTKTTEVKDLKVWNLGF